MSFGQDRIYYNNFASHLLNSYNPNMLYPQLPHRWSDDDWFAMIDMIASFGFSHFEFWLVPRLFCEEGIASSYGREFFRQINTVIAHARDKNIRTIMLCSLATAGSDWRTLCPNDPSEWQEIRQLWDRWTTLLPGLGGVAIFPGDPGACSRNGCTAETYIDRSADISAIIHKNLPECEIEVSTWGPPFFGWGNIEGPTGWNGEFVQEYQHSAWVFSKERMERSMHHLLRRLQDFPPDTVVGINLGFNPDGNPHGDESGIPWANEIAKTNPIRTWDFSLTEGENNIIPHYRFKRLFDRRKLELDSAPYRGGICFTMSPMLNQLSLWESAQSFIDPFADQKELAESFFSRLFGPDGKKIVSYLPLFEVVKDWGNYLDIDVSQPEYHRKLAELTELLGDLRSSVSSDVPFHPHPESYRQELAFFSGLFTELSDSLPDYDSLMRRYWDHVYAIYDHLPKHVDPRPHTATRRLIDVFQGSGRNDDSPVAGKWKE